MIRVCLLLSVNKQGYYTRDKYSKKSYFYEQRDGSDSSIKSDLLYEARQTEKDAAGADF